MEHVIGAMRRGMLDRILRRAARVQSSAVLAIALLPLLVSACDRRCAGAGSGESAVYARQVCEAIPRVEETVGAKFKTPPKLELRTPAEAREFVNRQIDDSAARRELAGEELAFKRFGMIPDSLDLRALLRDLYAEQVIGYYDPRAKTLSVVRGADEAQTKLTLTHELVHALQDQYVNLDSLLSQQGDPDRQLAAQALVEGQATWVHLRLAPGARGIAINTPNGWQRTLEQMASAQGSMPVMARTPRALRDLILFPYAGGAEFSRLFAERKPGTTPFGDIPLSTRQLLHEDAYFTRRAIPTRVVLPPASGAQTVYDGNLGEEGTRVLLRTLIKDERPPARGAEGLAGDRYSVIRTPNGDGIVWLTIWDDVVEGSEFFDILNQGVRLRFAAATRSANGETERTLDVPAGKWGGPRSIALRAVEVQGRPAVLYVDVPKGTSTSPIDLGRVRLR